MTVNKREFSDEPYDDGSGDIDIRADFFTEGSGDDSTDWGADGEDAFLRERDGERDDSQGDYELEERHALRRVAGMSTELEDITEVEYRQLRLERVVLVGVWTEGTVEDADNSLAELKLLAETAGSEVLDALSQRRQKPDPATYIGPGKVDYLRVVVAETGADTVICDGELSPSQLRNLEDKVKVKVVDRTALILDIFAQHARSKEGKAQVELAQLEYLKQRLRGWGGNLSRQAGGRVGVQGGGIGGRGPGETKLETDRRRITTRMAKLRRELKHMATARVTKKAERVRREIPVGRDRGLHERRQVVTAQPADRRGRARRGRAVRDPRPDHAACDDERRAGLHAVRHRRVRAPPAAPARRGVPLDAGGGRRLRPDRARRRRFARRPRGPARRRARGAGGDRRRPGARARRDQQVRRRRPARRAAAARPRAPRRRGLGPHG